MQKTKDGYRWTIRLSNKDYAQKEVIRMFEYLLATGEYATESDIFREGIKSLYREKTEPDRITDWDNRIQECARITADNMMERMQTMQEAMDFGKQYVEKFLPGHQAILAVHPDGHNGTGNVHVHIVINSVRKYEGKKERWQDKPCEYRQGCKHKSTSKFMHAAKRWVMRECMVKGYNQVNLLARSDGNNYWVGKRGKEANPDFKTDKDMIRERLDALIQHAESLDHMIYYLEHVEDWQIRETNKTISFRMPHMKKSIRGKSLGEKYDKEALEQRIEKAMEAKEEAERIRKAREEAIRNEQERMRLADSEWRQSEKLAQHEEAHTTRTEASVLKEPVDEFEEASNNEYDMTFATKLEQATVTSPDMDVISEAMDIRAKLICLEYEQEYNLNKISDLDYEIRHHNPNYQSYVENQALIRKKQSYINQWTQELGQCKLFQRDLKKYYKEQIQEAESEISDIKEANTKILAKAGCRNEDELRCYQDSYQQKRNSAIYWLRETRVLRRNVRR